MKNALLLRSERLYSLLLQLYPQHYRQEFGEEMKFVFTESLKDAYKTRGDQGIVALWGRTVLDTGKSLILEHREQRGGGDGMKHKETELIKENKIFLWLAAGTAAVLSLPYLAMQYHWVKPDPMNPTDQGVNWTMGDFIVMGLLIFGMGSIFIFAARRVDKRYRLLVGFAVLAAFLLIWVHLAVGIVGSWPLAGS